MSQEIDTSPAALRALADELNPVGGTISVDHDHQIRIAATLRALAAEKEAAPDLLNALDTILRNIEDLAANSEGVAGLHKNGEVVPWAVLLSGGTFGSWLGSIDVAHVAIAKAGGRS